MEADALKKELERLVLTPQKFGLFIWGAPGVGKSSVVKQITEEKGMGLIDLRLPLLNPIDLRGLPVPNREEKRADWLSPSFLPRENRDGKKGILLLDELTAAPPAVQVAALQLVLDRRVGEYILPDGWAVIAAGNRQKDRTVAYGLVAPLANRLVHYELDADLEAWRKWAMKEGVDSRVIAFLEMRPDLLIQPVPDGEIRGYPTPRSWEFTSILIRDRLVEDAYMSVAGAIGEGAAVEFNAYAKNVEVLKSVEEYIEGAELPTKDPDLLRAVSVQLAQWLKKTKNVKGYMTVVQKMPREFQVFSVKLVIEVGVSQLLLSSSDFATWGRDVLELLKEDE